MSKRGIVAYSYIEPFITSVFDYAVGNQRICPITQYFEWE